MERINHSTSLEVALMAIIASVYAIGTVVLAPISFLAIQVRLTDALIPLAFYLRRPAVAGVTIGCIVANIFSPFGFIDILVGTVANFLAAASCMYAPRWEVAGVAASFIVGVLIGTELAFLFGLESWLFFVLTVTIGSVIAIAIMGTLVLKVVIESFPMFRNAFPRW